VAGLQDAWETRRFKRTYKRILRDEIFGKVKKKRNVRRIAGRKRKNLDDGSFNFTGVTLHAFVEKFKDLEHIPGDGKMSQIIVRSTGKAFPYVKSTDDEKLVMARIMKYVDGGKYSRIVCKASSSANCPPSLASADKEAVGSK